VDKTGPTVLSGFASSDKRPLFWHRRKRNAGALRSPIFRLVEILSACY